MTQQTGPDPASTANPPFESVLSELEGLVQQLERGDASLDDSLQIFERGMSLAHRGNAILEAAEKRVEMLVKGKDGELRAEPFQSSEEP
jgi:exodeoxyribonuclease VII small subunit